MTMRQMSWLAGVCILGLVVSAGCSDDPDRSSEETADDVSVDVPPADGGSDAGGGLPGTPLVEADGWSRVSPADDPFESPSGAISCEGTPTKVEPINGLRALGVSTSSCNYVTVGQEAKRAVTSGQYLHVRAWHFDLTAPEGESARMEISIGGETVWRVDRQIPADSCLFAEDIAIDSIGPVSTGDPVRFHVRNHGSNEYYLIGIQIVDEPVGASVPSCN